METVIPLTRKAAAVLAERGIEHARLEAELLLAATLGLPRLDLYLQHDRPVVDHELAAYRVSVKRRLRGEPLQYIVGVVQFRELELTVDARVLIPRPETEVLVESVIAWTRERAEAGRPARDALEIGTGCGAIGLSLVRETELERVVATDVSDPALDVARANAARMQAARRIEFRLGALWDPVPAERFDVIVSNPPYVAESERAGLDASVRDWEPAVALFAGAQGMDVLAGLVAGAPAHLNPSGLLAVEVGVHQAERVKALAAEYGLERGRVIEDLTGHARIVTAEAPSGEAAR